MNSIYNKKNLPSLSISFHFNSMWTKVAEAIIKYRLIILIIIGLSTCYMGYLARKVEMSYDYLKILPTTDPDLAYLNNFKKTFGEDGNMVVIGFKDSSVYQLDKFVKFKQLGEKIAKIKGIKDVLFLPSMKVLSVNDSAKRFDFKPFFPAKISSQSQLDSLLAMAKTYKMYDGQLFNSANGALLMAITIKKEVLNTENRVGIVYGFIAELEKFGKENNIEMHTAGIPYIRSVMSKEVAGELKVFLGLSTLVSAIMLLFFFRSAISVIVPLILVAIVVVWTMASLVIFGYKISLLSGLIPSLIVITGIPNFIYLFNKYHQEYKHHGNKHQAITSIIKSIGFVTFMVNATSAVGFWVLCNNDVSLLKEFGIVAGLNIMVAFVISMVFIPAVLSYLPPPTVKEMRHLEFDFLNKILNYLVFISENKRKEVYILSALVAVISCYGITKINSISFMLDDIPERLTLKADMKFFEKNFKGIMPLEFVINTGKPKGTNKLKNLKKVDEFEQYLSTLPEISAPISLNTFLKSSTQAYFDGDSMQYRLPTSSEAPFILRYLKSQGKENQDLIKTLVDSTGQTMRVSCKIADVGSMKLDTLINQKIKPKIKEIFGDTDIKVKITGTTMLSMKGNNLLIESLNGSIFQSILFCTALMAMLFSSFRMIIISIIPNILPLLITAAIMGYFGIPLKPSTAIIFSIVFGITVDNTIHYLAKYRYEIFHKKKSIKESVLLSIRETGASQIYTSMVLFVGFIIYVASSFGGTISLGLLTSITLLTALVINLTLLPALVMNFDRGRKEKDFGTILEHYEDFYYEEDDEDIDCKQISTTYGAVSAE